MSRIHDEDIRGEGLPVLWNDRKHHLWFPLSFTKYKVDAERLYISKGLLSSREDECLLYRILDVTLTRSLGQRLCGTGTIELNTKDRSTPVVRLENISQSKRVKQLISELIEKSRMRHNLVGRDMYGSSAHIDPVEMDPDLLDDMDMEIPPPHHF